MRLGEVLWSLLVIFFMVMYFMALFMVISDLFRDRKLSGWWKAVWIVFFFIAPLLSLLIYLVARGGGMAERQAALVQAADAAQKAYIQSAVGSSAPADQIASAKALLDAGTISQSEFEALKAKALAQ